MQDTHTIKAALKKGLVQIFSANFINKIIQFGIVMLLTRILSVNLYGKFVYAQSILNMFLLLEGLGMVSGSLQYCSMENIEEKRLSYFKYAIKIGGMFNLIIAVCIIIYTTFFKLPVEGSTQILFYMSLMPLLTIFFNEIQVLLRSEFRNNEFSSLTVINTLLYFMGNIVLGRYFSIKGIIIGRYISYIISILIGIYMIRNGLKKLVKIDYPKLKEKKDFLKYSVVCCFTNAMSQILYMMDTFFVGIIIKDSSVVASYSAAAQIPFNLTFIPMSIMIFAYPYFARHWNDKKWIKDKYKMLIKYLFIFNLIITIILIVFAPYIINIVFTRKYSDAVTNFRILSIGYLVAGTFRTPSGNILASMKLVKVNFYNSMITGIANILLNVILINRLGSLGASLATVSVYIISSILYNIYLRRYINN
ncbi:oligosaccharide flippase family protein [Clostridium tyrobutyricum]|jgi:O-antigen/teichoic acid export membrane protein|uniref:Polysaccharide biosynthesis export protein n=1 Tax=Clostridium tyrobutyricum DIVETGP TaxID=1408889 RepID=W6N3J9_CLOTY|nr:oligosaccharide flippase family protein [Clostridium tyrobutyricum]AND84135.1 Polysaccharide biosynthesis protein [Clostridium tyrobutyricum]ANP68862.1 polysaccharide biosynthesis protein [Clostridium tyrobutyricum]MBV4434463.1 oligosaccharide flippase family protein [Clostridium tyrobutyricum]MBV4437424.1 oligosaccharide flippase family protein [Clostridium tyrobutyricum]MBV4439171.1 oligosaccharide flippase family protein [Clostridium tyrobutyricum]